MKTVRNPETIHHPVAGYHHQIEVSGPMRWLVLSGQIGQRPDRSVPEDPIEQLSEALANIERNLEAAGMEVTDVVKLTCYLVGSVDADRRRAVIGDWLGDHLPCMTLLFVAGLASPAYRVEIDALACVDDASAQPWLPKPMEDRNGHHDMQS